MRRSTRERRGTSLAPSPVVYEHAIPGSDAWDAHQGASPLDILASPWLSVVFAFEPTGLGHLRVTRALYDKLPPGVPSAPALPGGALATGAGLRAAGYTGPMAFTFRFPVRFEDVDYARIVYYPRLFQYCHWTFEAFFPQEAGLTYAQLVETRKIGFPTVHAEADFVSPLRFGDECRVVMHTARLGTRSVTNAYLLHAGDAKKPSAELEIVTVAIDMETFQPVELPEDLRAAFRKHLEGGKPG